MAMENKRIIQLNTERTTPAADDYVMVDSATAGTAKYLLPKITDAIDQEISDRTSADTTLQTAITNEATARTNADTTLQGNITAEATARAAADTAINGEITQLKEDLEAEETARENAISAEADAREAADDAINAELATKADTDGAIASAEQLLSDKYTIDQVPYTFRASGSDGADREYDEIVGGSIAWNQLMRISQNDLSKTQNGVTITDNRNGTYTVSTDANGATENTYLALSNANVPFKSGYKYLLCGTPSTGSANTYYSYIAGMAIVYDYGTGVMFSANVTGDSTPVVAYVKQGTIIATPVTFKPQFFDLTAMFGSTIADYIYSLEQATAGAGVAWFRKLFPKDYYAYDAGTMMHVSDLQSHDTVGFNALNSDLLVSGKWIDTANGNVLSNYSTRKTTIEYIRCLPNTSYYFGAFENGNLASNDYAISLCFYDEQKQFISGTGTANRQVIVSPQNAMYLRVGASFLQYDICINLHWDGERDGEYEPYVKHSYPLDDSLTLRGILKLDSNNQLYYDGDTYAADGTVTRKYGVRAYQSGDVTGDNMITDGTNTVYKLTNPTTETAEPYTNPQIVDPDGTEEYVTTSIVPVGHYTKYPANLRSAIERVMEQIPEAPSANGTYTLKATRTSSGVTYAWTAE